MSLPCTDCLRGPSGITGHDNLFVDTMSTARLGFTCRACGWVWARSYAGEGAFRWELKTNVPAQRRYEIGWFVPGGRAQPSGK